MKQNIVIGLVSVLSVVALVMGYFGVTRQQVSPPFGASVGPDSFFNRECHNGVCTLFFQQPFNVGTTTACVFKTQNATTSLTYFHAQPTTATGTIFTAVLATSTSASSGGAILTTTGISTTSILAWAVYAANSAAAFVFEPGSYQTSIGFGGTALSAGQAVLASTTPWILPPNTYIIYEGEGGGIVPAGASAAQIGKCTARADEL